LRGDGEKSQRIRLSEKYYGSVTGEFEDLLWGKIMAKDLFRGKWPVLAVIFVLAGVFIVLAVVKKRDGAAGKTDVRVRHDNPGVKLSPPVPGNAQSTPVGENRAVSNSLSPEKNAPPQVSDSDVRDSITLMELNKTWLREDRIMAAWPDYDDVKEQIGKELSAKMDPEKMSEKEILESARQLRDQYWDVWMGYSESAYQYAYQARFLLESAMSRNPNSAEIIDDLAEAIQATYLASRYDAEQKKYVPANQKTRQLLFTLKSREFDIQRKEIAEGRTPNAKDFACAYDLAYLQQRYAMDKDKAPATVQWLLDNAEQGKWTRFNDTLHTIQDDLAQGEFSGSNIYISVSNSFPAEYRYARRLLGFRGPSKANRVIWVFTNIDMVLRK
jgi:hypothetical protein